MFFIRCSIIGIYVDLFCMVVIFLYIEIIFIKIFFFRGIYLKKRFDFWMIFLYCFFVLFGVEILLLLMFCLEDMLYVLVMSGFFFVM